MTKGSIVGWTEPGTEEVAPGVHRIPLPLPMDGLRAVNVYAIIGRDRHTLVDGGWDIPVAVEALETALGTLGMAPADFEQCLVTHHHRDHYTLAVRLRQRVGLTIGLGEGESEQLASMRVPGPAFAGQRPVLLAAGAERVADAVTALAAERVDPGTWAEPDRWLTDEEKLAAADRTLRVRATPGHTQGHVVYLDDEADIIFAGDHVLPHITPSIGFQSQPTQAPLTDYLDSLAAMLEESDRLLLPAHGPAGGSLHRRVEELLDHHEVRLSQTEAAVRAGASTGLEVAEALRWTRHERHLAEMDPFNQMLATTETLAHLQVLRAQGRVTEVSEDGLWRYT